MSDAPTFLQDRRPAWVPLWRESLVGVDWLRLRAAPVYYGVGAPRGDGAAVVVVPGFLGTDTFYLEMRAWLRRIGYRPYASGIRQNADCLDVLARRLIATTERASGETGGPVHLVGHSLGGVLSVGVAGLRPELVASVTTLGSPIRGIRSHPAVLRMGERVGQRVRRQRPHRPDCYTGLCECAFVDAAVAGVPEEVPMLSVYTRSDGVVAWRFCMHPEPERNAEVRGTHCGLVLNPQVYGVVARFLASPRL